MPTLRRILKCMPAAVMVCLVSVWIASLFGSLRLWLPWLTGDWRLLVWVIGGDVVFGYGESSVSGPRFEWQDRTWDLTARMIVGTQPYWDHASGILRLPIAFILAALLPLATGLAIQFRFRLWHYLAYTALVAVELAYYLRWQS
jgi:hypothetical protein